MKHLKCIVCGRKLKTTYAQNRGMGRICEAKMVAPQLNLFPITKRKKNEVRSTKSQKVS